jgi:hypothetical protein
LNRKIYYFYIIELKLERIKRETKAKIKCEITNEKKEIELKEVW